jgi:hypothetical protein
VAPGGNFDLSMWELQLPVGSQGSPTTISSSKLVGPQGYSDSYFFTDPTDGSMSFWDPEGGVTTPNSNYARSELAEMLSGQIAHWTSAGTNTLSATLKVTELPSHVCVGQVHVGAGGSPASVRPLFELFYFATGEITLGIEQTPAGGNEQQHTVGHVPMGTQWSYVLDVSGSTISVTLGGGAAGGGTQTFPIPSSFASETYYYKAGDYDQSTGSSMTVGAKVQFYALSVAHAP